MFSGSENPSAAGLLWQVHLPGQPIVLARLGLFDDFLSLANGRRCPGLVTLRGLDWDKDSQDMMPACGHRVADTHDDFGEFVEVPLDDPRQSFRVVV